MGEAQVADTHLSPTASMGSSSSLISCWMPGPIARASMLIQVNTVASTCMAFCLLQGTKRVITSYTMTLWDVPPPDHLGTRRAGDQTWPKFAGAQIIYCTILGGRPHPRHCRFEFTTIQQMAVMYLEEGAPFSNLHTRHHTG